ncbi:MAG: sigma-54-dependent Fis family transcriptional regulator [Salinisphaeraceae bacterium]|jgi:DNA-binding NtrC family response regulator/predicted hydrocarbon binding protein|nr:sigma-54-dependent Fis family transcriptional regulator [Salinisphaeraceae bacterium]
MNEKTGNTDLTKHVRFEPDKGRIWLEDQRMVLLHSSGLGVMRRELIETLGTQAARGLITRIGYNSGARDAELARRLRGSKTAEEAVSAGPELHMIEGIVRVEAVRVEVDEQAGHFYGEYIWHGSVEGEEHVRAYGTGHAPACWMQVGYASGFISVFMGAPVFMREVECCAKGDPHCRIVGKPVDEWDDAEADLQYLRADAVTSGLSRSRPGALPDVAEQTGSSLGGIEVVGASAGFNAACHMVRRVANTQATVIFLGESGVGKEVLARGLHAASDRRDQPFVAINCAAIPDNLIEAELFGVEKGAFTGAQSGRPGRFERADGGTLFLDEIGILSWTAQGKLLRALQAREIERVGDTRVRQVDVRVVAATNLDLREQVRQGAFREDLYFRLNVFPIRVPPLRERKEDIPIFMNFFLKRFNERHGRSVRGFTWDAINTLMTHDYPGNIRELENMIERGSILAEDGGAIDTAQLFAGDSPNAALEGPTDTRTPPARHAAIHEAVNALLDQGEGSWTLLEQQLLRRAVELEDGNLSAAARRLGLSRPQLAYRLERKPAG